MDIKIEAQSTQQILNPDFPSPFQGQELSSAFASYLEHSVEKAKLPLRIQIQIPTTEPAVLEALFSGAIRSFYRFKIEQEKEELTKHRKTSRFFLIIGLMVLSMALLLSHFTEQYMTSLLGVTLREGFVIFGWVSMWRPLEVLFFDWYPIHNRIKKYKKLAKTEVSCFARMP